MDKMPSHDLILKLLKEKTIVQLNVRNNIQEQFKVMKQVLAELAKEIAKKATELDKRINVQYKELNESEVMLTIAEDVLIFYLQTNIFTFDRSHPVWQTSYVKKSEANAFCGNISIYNFLSDSFKYSRANDLGYLIARIFVNHEMHYFVEGKRQLGFLYNNFSTAVLDKPAIADIIDSAIIYTLDFSLFAPPFDNVKEVSVSVMEEEASRMQMATGKRLGFRFGADNDQIK
ncbi:MAG TPA: hypothetical protein VK783_15140 [Bacteroidia bacterium]|jgi:hypothetical protein|nr:hypothetical protein [Bacteroidia bacterium]